MKIKLYESLENIYYESNIPINYRIVFLEYSKNFFNFWNLYLELKLHEKEKSFLNLVINSIENKKINKEEIQQYVKNVFSKEKKNKLKVSLEDSKNAKNIVNTFSGIIEDIISNYEAQLLDFKKFIDSNKKDQESKKNIYSDYNYFFNDIKNNIKSSNEEELLQYYIQYQSYLNLFEKIKKKLDDNKSFSEADVSDFNTMMKVDENFDYFTANQIRHGITIRKIRTMEKQIQIIPGLFGRLTNIININKELE